MGDKESEESEPETLQPIIVAEMETRIPSLSVGEAVMQMELAGAPVLVFRNEGSNGVNVVYRREDGNIGWIDPNNADQQNVNFGNRIVGTCNYLRFCGPRPSRLFLQQPVRNDFSKSLAIMPPLLTGWTAPWPPSL